MQTALYTYSDVISALTEWAGSATTDAMMLKKAKRAVEAAYREIANARRWSYFIVRGRLDTVDQYVTGTIAYTNSTRAVTLSGGTFPTWAAFGTLSVSGVEYPAVSRDSSTQITLSVNSNPGADIVAGTSYLLWRDTYPIPVDMIESGTIKDAFRNNTLQWIEPNDWIAMRMSRATAAVPYYYTIMADPHYTGALCFRLYPPPSVAYHYDYMYHRRPRPLLTPQYNTGTITSSGTVVTGVGTTWTSQMVGCVLRNSVNNTSLPTGTEGSNPYVNQRIVASWSTATSIAIDQAFDTDISTAAKYEISDPIDMEEGAMYSAFLRKAEKELGTQQRRSDLSILEQEYQRALALAAEGDNRSFDRKPENTRYFRRTPLYYDIANVSN